SLFDWRNVDLNEIFLLLIKPLFLISRPFIHGLEVGLPGMPLLVSQNRVMEFDPKNFPMHAYELFSTGSGFASPDSCFSVQSGLMSISESHVYGMLPWEDEKICSDSFIEWCAASASKILKNFTDLFYLYPLIISNGPGMPQEHIMTFDRFALRVAKFQSTHPRSIDRTEIFEIADLFGKIRSVWRKSDENDESKWVLSATGVKEMVSAIKNSSCPNAHAYSTRLAQVWSAVSETIVSSVWDKNRVSDKHVDISYNSDKSDLETIDEYTTNFLRDLRNTHHGYSLRSNRSKRRLLISTGAVSEGLSSLPVLWLLSVLCDPHITLGCPKMEN
ncbi:MAG: hypothetical protein JKY43_07520, partial [Phycisphaerales bacterium]|nr:hypothetical protein [Phycisphaerales bacterium]